MAAALCLLTPIANAEAPLTGARAAVLLEAETGRVLFEKNADERLAIASTTKIMTALLAIESCAMDEIVTAGKNASGVPGTSIYLSEGEQLTMEEMLYGLMLRSGNDAAVAIAEHIGGSVPGRWARTRISPRRTGWIPAGTARPRGASRRSPGKPCGMRRLSRLCRRSAGRSRGRITNTCVY